MKKFSLFIVLIFFILELFSYNSISDWRYIKHDRYTIYYPDGQYLYAKYALNTLRYYADNIDEITTNERKQAINIVLEDTGEYYNGSANPIENKLRFFLNTPNTNSSITSQEWLNMLVIHEYTHHSHLTSTHKTPLLLAKIFGNIFSPNLYSPMWMIEGITVRNESYFSPYMGRLNNAYYAEIINAQLRDDCFQNHISANYYLEDFPLGNYYVYGGSFVKWLSDIYGEEQISRFYKHYGSNLRNVFWSSLFPKYTLDRSANKIFNKGFPALFKQWKNYLEMSANFQKNIATDYLKYDWDNTLLVNSLTSNYNDKLYFFDTKKFFNHYRSNIIEYDVKKQQSNILYSSNSQLSTNMEFYDDNLYFSEEEVKFTGNNLVNMGYSGTSVLKKYNIYTGKISTILSKPFKDFTIAENKAVYYSIEDNNTGTSSLYKYYKNHHSLVENYPFLISELLYKNNNIYITYKYPNSSWDIGLISTIDNSFTPLVTSKSQEKNLSLCNDILVFTSNQDNLSQAYQYDLKLKTITKISDNYFADNPLVIDKALYYKSISGKGERISVKSLKIQKSDLETLPDSRLVTVLDDEYIEKEALAESMKNILLPYVRYPFGFFSSDGIGYFDLNANWYFDTDNHGILGVNLSTKILSPFLLNLYLNSDNDNFLSAQVDIYNSAINCLQNINLQGGTDFDDEYLLGSQLVFRKFNAYLTNKYMRDLSNSGYSNKTILSYYFKKLQLTSFYEKIKDFDESPNFSEYNITDGKSNYHDYGIVASFNLFKVRNGLWTPNVAMKDIDVNLGIYANNYKSQGDISYFKISTISDYFAASVLQFTIETGLYFNKEKATPFISFGSEF